MIHGYPVVKYYCGGLQVRGLLLEWEGKIEGCLKGGTGGGECLGGGQGTEASGALAWAAAAPCRCCCSGTVGKWLPRQLHGNLPSDTLDAGDEMAIARASPIHGMPEPCPGFHPCHR